MRDREGHRARAPRAVREALQRAAARRRRPRARALQDRGHRDLPRRAALTLRPRSRRAGASGRGAEARLAFQAPNARRQAPPRRPRSRACVREPPRQHARHATTLDDDHFHDECGVFGIYGHPEAANITYLGLHALQHRGQESAGIVTSDGEQLYAHRAMGLVQDAFTPGAARASCPGASPSATSATPPPAARTSRTRSRSRSTTRAARSRSATTATSRTPTSSAPSSRRAGSIFQIDERHRGARPPRRARASEIAHRGPHRRRARAQVQGRVLAPLPHRGHDHRRARSDGHPPALPRHPARRRRTRTSSPASRPRSISSAPSTCATSSRAR